MLWKSFLRIYTFWNIREIAAICPFWCLQRPNSRHIVNVLTSPPIHNSWPPGTVVSYPFVLSIDLPDLLIRLHSISLPVLFLHLLLLQWWLLLYHPLCVGQYIFRTLIQHTSNQPTRPELSWIPMRHNCLPNFVPLHPKTIFRPRELVDFSGIAIISRRRMLAGSYMGLSLVVDIILPGPDIFNCHNHIQLSNTNNLIFAFLPSPLLPLDPSYLDHAHKESLVV